MPYISEERRYAILEAEDPIAEMVEAGDLNYMISAILNEYVNEKGLNYKTINEVIGVLECAKLELYRRIAAPYEDMKIQENGDVYNDE